MRFPLWPAGSAFLSQWVRSSGELDARDEEGKAAMHMAVECRDVDAVRVLLRSGAQADVAQTGTVRHQKGHV